MPCPECGGKLRDLGVRRVCVRASCRWEAWAPYADDEVPDWDVELRQADDIARARSVRAWRDGLM